MGRKKDVIAPEAQAMDLIAQKGSQNLAIAKKLLDANTVLGEEYTALSYIHAARNAFELHEKSGLVGGALLLAIRENEDHGSFLKALDQIGISKSKAYRYLHIAERYSKFPNLGSLNNSKLELLDEFSDPELEKLNDGEQVRGMTIDEWESLSATKARGKCREFEARIKKLEEDRKHESTMREGIITQKEKKIAELERSLRGLGPPTVEQRAEIQLQELNKDYMGALYSTITDINQAINSITKAQSVEGITYPLLRTWMGRYAETVEGVTAAYNELMDCIKQPCIDREEEQDEQPEQ
jgi:hypothetical protein